MKNIIRDAFNLLRKSNVPEINNSIHILKQEAFLNSKLPLHLRIRKFQQLIKLRCCHIPIQYLCKEWPFGELTLTLKPPILIPRFETEFMMNILYQKIKEKYNDEELKYKKFVQYGCGSGAIGLSLQKKLGIEGVMVDIEERCINLSMKNGRKNKCDDKKLEFIHGRMEDYLNIMQTADIIVSNPPYLSENHYNQKLHRQVKKFQSKQALVGGEDGMKYIDLLIEGWLKKKKKGTILMLEYDGRKLTNEREWVGKYVIKDQYERNRFIYMQN